MNSGSIVNYDNIPIWSGPVEPIYSALPFVPSERELGPPSSVPISAIAPISPIAAPASSAPTEQPANPLAMLSLAATVIGILK